MNDEQEPNEDSHLESAFEERTHLEDDQEQKFLNEAAEIREADMNRGFPGDGSGEDDFADFNANEADDYRNEGE